MLDQEAKGRALDGVTALCSWARHFYSTSQSVSFHPGVQMGTSYFNAGSTCNPARGSRLKYSRSLNATESGLGSSCMDHWPDVDFTLHCTYTCTVYCYLEMIYHLLLQDNRKKVGGMTNSLQF